MTITFSGQLGMSGNIALKKGLELTLLEAITNAGLTTNLEFCLDAGDLNSYNGSSQTWTDVSGNSNDFWRGTSGSPNVAEPTFNGTAGGLTSNEYWSFDGADWFRKVTANGTNIDSLHKQNADQTVLVWLQRPVVASPGAYVLGTHAGPAQNDGWNFNSNNVGNLVCFSGANGATITLNRTSVDIVPNETPIMIGVSYNEASGGSFFFHNDSFIQVSGASDTFNDAYTATSTNPATAKMEIGGSGDGAGTHFDSGYRVYMIALFMESLTKSETDVIYNTTKGRFNL